MNKRLFKKISKTYLCFIIWNNFYEIYKNINFSAKRLYQIYTEVEFNHSTLVMTDICECGDCKFLRRNFYSIYPDVIPEFDGTCQITKLPTNEEFGCYDKFQKISFLHDIEE